MSDLKLKAFSQMESDGCALYAKTCPHFEHTLYCKKIYLSEKIPHKIVHEWLRPMLESERTQVCEHYISTERDEKNRLHVFCKNLKEQNFIK